MPDGSLALSDRLRWTKPGIGDFTDRRFTGVIVAFLGNLTPNNQIWGQPRGHFQAVYLAPRFPVMNQGSPGFDKIA